MKQLSLFKNDKPKARVWNLYDDDGHGVSEKPSRNTNLKKFRSKEEYYKSEEWQEKRKYALHRAGHRCSWCVSGSRLEVHHLTYVNLYHEKPEDLLVLCKKCHAKADIERAHKNWRHKAFNTYITKKYGEGYEANEYDEKKFDNWIKIKRGY